MTTHLTKIWWDLNKDKLVEQLIPESEIYKREWVGLTLREIEKCIYDANDDPIIACRNAEAKLRERNT